MSFLNFCVCNTIHDLNTYFQPLHTSSEQVATNKPHLKEKKVLLVFKTLTQNNTKQFEMSQMCIEIAIVSPVNSKNYILTE